MRTITTLFGSTLCAFALLVAPVQAKDDKEKPATCPSCPSKEPAPAKESINVGDNGKCDKKDCDKDKPATCPDKDSAAAKESINVGDNGKCDRKDCDKDKPATCPSKDPAPAKESINLDNHCGKCDKKDDDKEKPAVCPSCPSPEKK